MSPKALNGDPPSEDLVELLDNARRRRLLRFLLDDGGEADLRELSRRIAAEERDTTARVVDGDGEGDVASVYRTLHKRHVPALADRDLIEYDETERVVSLGDRGEEVVAALADSRRGRRRWAVRYLVVALCLGVVLVASESGFGPVSPTVVSMAAIGGAATFLGLAGVQYYRTQSGRGTDPSLDWTVD